MDVVHEPGVRKVALEKSAQVGGTSAIENIIGYYMEHDPCPTLLIQPTDEAAEEFSKERLDDMLRTTPAIARTIDTNKSTLTYKEFAGGFLVLGGAKSPNSFARRTVRLGIADDFDRFPAVVGEEGDPADLLENRTNTFPNGLLLFVSTPTLKGGRIDTLFQRSDRRRYIVRCPRCGFESWITWSDPSHFHVGFDAKDPSTARLECASDEHGGCGAHLTEAQRREMVMAGDWRPTTVGEEPGLVGFHLPAMITTLGSASLSHWVAAWLSARARGKESLRVFVNTTLAEGWEDRTAKLEPNIFMARREDYGDGIEVPAAAVCLTAGVDVQDDRFELLVEGWGPAEERWVVDWRRIPGDPRQQETRDALLEALGRRYPHALGVQLPILATCIDTGYATEEMYNFVLAYQVRRFYATKGFGGRSGEPIVGKPAEKRYGKNPRPVALYPINTDDAKGDILASLNLNLASTLDGTPSPGATHFPLQRDTVGEEFFAQLCAEHRETKYNKANVATHTIWVQDRDRNEALDCAVLCLAAKRLLNPNIKQMAQLLEQAAAKARTDPTPAAAPKAPERRVVRSSYLQR